MKRTNTAPLKIHALDGKSLELVHGGRGSYCGNLIHCDCGYAWVDDGSVACPSCGAATELSAGAASGGGGGGGGGGGSGGGGGGCDGGLMECCVVE